MRSLRSSSVLILAAAVSVSAAGCKKNGEAKLPPATGEGAAPLPALPVLDGTKPDQPVGASEGRTTGSLFPHAEAQLAPSAGGTILSIRVKESDRVKKGDLLFQLDSRDAMLRRDQAKAALSAAEVNLRATQVEYDRTKVLFEQNAVPLAAWQAVQARWEGAQVGVQQAKVALAMAGKMINDASVHAPFSGVITAKLKNEGEMATMMPPTVVLILQDQETLDLHFKLPEKALATIKTGSKVKAAFTSVGLTREAAVTRISASVDQRTRTIELVAELPNTDQALRPGLLAEIEVVP